MRIALASDLHLSARRPLCRIDADWVATQKARLNELCSKSEEMHCDALIIAGDVFDTPTVDPEILSLIINAANKAGRCFMIAGNHDLPYHNTAYMERSSFGVLRAMSNCMSSISMPDEVISYGGVTISGNHYGESGSQANVVALHTFAVENESKRPPFHESITADELLARYPDARLIVVGDNHESWTVTKGGRSVVNCGCFIRRNVKELDYTPCFYVWDSEDESIRRIAFTDDRDSIDASYIAQANEAAVHELQYEAMLNELKAGIELSFDFLSTLESYVKDNAERLDGRVVDYIESLIREMKR